MGAAKVVRVLLTSKHGLMMSAIEALLSHAPGGLSVVGASTTVPELAKKLRRLKPDVLLADVTQVQEGLLLLGQLAQEFPQARIVVLSAIDEPPFARTLLNNGVSGYVLKTSTEAELALAIRYVSQGRKFLDPALVDAMFAPSESNDNPSSNGNGCSGLSEREEQVFHAIVRGCTNRDIAQELKVSAKTIESYRARIYAKLRLNSRFDLVRYAIDNGLISVHEKNDP